jgi:hypothetical protein
MRTCLCLCVMRPASVMPTAVNVFVQMHMMKRHSLRGPQRLCLRHVYTPPRIRKEVQYVCTHTAYTCQFTMWRVRALHNLHMHSATDTTCVHQLCTAHGNMTLQDLTPTHPQHVKCCMQTNYTSAVWYLVRCGLRCAMRTMMALPPGKQPVHLCDALSHQ